MPELGELLARPDADDLIVTLMQSTQGHILGKHKRDHIWSLLFRIEPGAEAKVARRFADLTHGIASAHDLYVEECRCPKSANTSHFQPKRKPVSFLGFAATGCKKLGVNLERFAPEFSAGLRDRLEVKMRINTATWDSHWKNSFDGIVIVAADQFNQLTTLVTDLSFHFSGYLSKISAVPESEVFVIERGKVKRGPPSGNRKGPALEHFGFADGISQPVFLEDLENARNTRWTSSYDPAARLTQLLLPDPFCEPGADAFGSFMAYMNIEQHVGAFKRLVSELAAKHPTPAGVCPMEYAASRVIGRRYDGTPLTGGFGHRNDFDRACDPDGGSWPFKSHISKMNARDGSGLSPILRRGVTYEEMGRKGLLFQSFQSDLEFQFEVQLTSWANNPNHPRPATGVDTLMPLAKNPSNFAWTNNGKGCGSELTTLRGGEYFYFPSIHGIRKLSS